MLCSLLCYANDRQRLTMAWRLTKKQQRALAKYRTPVAFVVAFLVLIGLFVAIQSPTILAPWLHIQVAPGNTIAIPGTTTSPATTSSTGGINTCEERSKDRVDITGETISLSARGTGIGLTAATDDARQKIESQLESLEPGNTTFCSSVVAKLKATNPHAICGITTTCVPQGEPTCTFADPSKDFVDFVSCATTTLSIVRPPDNTGGSIYTVEMQCRSKCSCQQGCANPAR